MARQRGIVKLSGKIGDQSFYKDKKHGDVARSPGGPSKEQIDNLESCQPIKKNSNRMAIASPAGKLLRTNMTHIIKLCSDTDLYLRIQAIFLKIMQTSDEMDLMKKDLRKVGLIELNVKHKAGNIFRFPIQRKKENDFFTRLRFHNSIFEKSTHCTIVSTLAGLDFNSREAWNNVQIINREVKDLDEVEFTHSLDGEGVLFHGFCGVGYREDERIEFGCGGIQFVA